MCPTSPSPADPSASLDDLLAYARRVCASLYPGESPEDMVLAFRSGRKLSLMIPGSGSRPEASINDSGSVLLWFGTRYEFTDQQGPGVKLLFAAWKDGTRDVGGSALLEAMDSRGGRVRDALKSSAAFQDGVIQLRDGKCRLLEPGEIE